MNNKLENLKPIRLEVLLLQETAPEYPLHLKVGERFIRYIEGATKEDLEALKLRGVSNVFLTQEDYLRFISQQVDIQAQEINRESNLTQSIVRSYLEDQEKLKLLFVDVGFEQEKLDLINSLNNKTLGIIQMTESLKELFQAFKNSNEISIIKKQMEIYLSTEMLRNLFKESEIGNLENYVSQMTRALLVSDLLLTEEEYWDSYNKPIKSLSLKIINHGPDIIKQLPTKDFLTPPFVTLIRDHHERPDGQGYPTRRNYTELNQFTSVYLIAESFISRFIKGKMKLNIIPDLVDEVNEDYKKYVNVNIEKSLKAFNLVMKNEKQYFLEGNNE